MLNKIEKKYHSLPLDQYSQYLEAQAEPYMSRDNLFVNPTYTIDLIKSIIEQG